MKIKEKFGIVIRQLRTEMGVSQEKLSLDANIDRTYISGIEKGERNVSIEMIERLATFFQISVSELFKKVEEYGK